MLYRCVQQHLETWIAQCRDGHDDPWSVPEYIEREFRRYLDCGILAHGFARARCGQCGHDFLIAFSCQGRGVCPSCNARRMVATAAHLTDHVLPPLPVRQWVLAVPKRLRYFLQRDGNLQGAARRLFLRAVASCLRAHSPGSSPAARLGAVAFIHRFGASLKAHLHFHCVVIDGVFDSAAAGGVVFHAAAGLDANAIADVRACARRRLLRVFVRRGRLPSGGAQAMGQWAHGGGYSVDGSVRIEAAGRERLRAFYRTYYQPDNAVLVVAGRFDAARTLALLARVFGAIPKPARTLPRLYTAEPVQDGERSVVVRRVGSEKLVAVLYRMPAGAHPDTVALDVLGDALTIEPAGRMYKALVETKQASSVWSWSLALADPGVLMFWAQLPLEEAAEPVRDAMLRELESRQPVSEAEVERIRTRGLTQFEQLLNDPQAVGIALSEAIALGDWRLLFVGRDRLHKVSADDVNRVAASYLKPANRTVGMFVPDAAPERAPESATVDVAA